MIEPMAIAGMVFTLLFAGMIGGFILLLPISRRLGAYLEQRLEQGKGEGAEAEMRQLRSAVLALQGEVEKLVERQEFTDSLLSRPTGRAGDALPPGDR